MKNKYAVLVFLISLGSLFKSCTSENTFKFKRNEKVVFLGNAFFENDVDKGEIETLFSLSFPDKKITFRNIGWSGDNVYAHARTRARGGGRFGDPEEGFQILSEQIAGLQPDKIFLAYGFNESFNDDEGSDAFEKGLERLIEMLKQYCSELIFISPFPMEKGLGVPDEQIDRQNQKLREYVEVSRQVALSSDVLFIDLFTLFENESKYTVNAIHLTSNGYRKAASFIGETLNLPQPLIDIDSEKAEKIRKTIIKKNTLFFHRWRPRNDAFVYGERKDEQRIAQEEPAQIEPFIAKEEDQINQQLQEL